MVNGYGGTYLLHVLEKFLATPPIQTPIIVILLAAAYAKCPIAATATSKKFASAELDLPIIDVGRGRSDNVPVCRRVEQITPANQVRKVGPIPRSVMHVRTRQPYGHFRDLYYAVQLQ